MVFLQFLGLGKSGIQTLFFSYFSTKPYIVGTHLKHPLRQTLLNIYLIRIARKAQQIYRCSL